MTAVSEDRPAADADTQAMREIAEHAGIPPEVVQALHAQELKRLAQHARLCDFIPLLAMKHVRDFFLHAGAEIRTQNPQGADRSARRLSREHAAAESRHKDHRSQQSPLLPQH